MENRVHLNGQAVGHKELRDRDVSCRKAVNTLDYRLCLMARSIGFDFFLMAELPRGDQTTFEENLVTSSWPEPLLDFYARSDLFFCSHIICSFRKTILPVYRGREAFAGLAANQFNQTLDNMMVEYGLTSTFAFTLHDINLKQYVLAFSGKREPLSREEMLPVTFAATELLDEYGAQQSGKDGPAEKLTPRELECLRWSAAGKSSEEIAIILTLSTHTVGGYLKTAMKKLDSVSRMQAVARAYRYRLL